MLLAALVSVALAATPLPLGPGIDAALIGETFKRFNAVAYTPLPMPMPEQLEELAAGEIVTMVHRREDGRYMVLGIARTGMPKEQVWVATQDPHYTGDEKVELNLSLAPHKGTWYGLLDIPRPFADRHWVIDVWDNVDLARQSSGRFWEHPWKRNSEALTTARSRVAQGHVADFTLDMFDAAVETPANDGALDFLELPGDDSIFVYAIVSAAGPGIPDRLIAAFVRRRMHTHVQVVLDRAKDVIPHHYRGAHAPVLGVDGAYVPLFP